MEGGVGVPGGEEAGAVGVEEDEGGGEVGVVVDYVGEVGHGFSAFVHGGRKGCVRGVGGGVDRVDRRLPAALFISKVRLEIKWSRAYSGKCSATQSVFSFSVLAMMTTLLLASPPKVGMFCTRPCWKVFFHEWAI